MKDIVIEFAEDFYGERVYYVGVIDTPHRPPLWVGKQRSLTRVKEDRAFVRDYDKALELVTLIERGVLKEGIECGLFDVL